MGVGKSESNELDSGKTENIKLRDSFTFANTIQFLGLFHGILDIDPLTPSKLEDALLEAPVQSEGESKLAAVYKKVIKALHGSRAPSDETLTKSLNREYKRHLVEEPDFLQHQLDGQSKIWPAWGTLSAAQHLQILHDLCSFQMFDMERFVQLPTYQDGGAAWRIDCLGSDKLGASYWLIGDCWLYRESTAANKEDGNWKCVAWDLSSWQAFLETTPLRNSRRQVDKALMTRLETELHPQAKEILGKEERIKNAKRKKEEQELQRELYLATRKRSSRIVAREKLYQQLVAQASPPRHPHTPTTVLSTAHVHKRPPSREERMAMREKRAIHRETEQVINDLMKQQSEPTDEHSDIPVDIEDDDQPRSPIKLLLKIGPDGATRTDLFIDNQLVEKQKNHLMDSENDLSTQPVPDNKPQDETPSPDAEIPLSATTTPNAHTHAAIDSIPASATDKEIVVANLLKDIAQLIHQ